MDIDFVGEDSFVTDFLFLDQEGFIFDVLFEDGREIVYQSRVDPDVTVELSGFFQLENGQVQSGNILGIEFFREDSPQLVLSDFSWSFDDYISAVLAGLNERDFQPFAQLLSQNGTINTNASNALAGYNQAGAWFEIKNFLVEPIEFIGSDFNDRVSGSVLGDIIRPGGNSDGSDVMFGSLGDDRYIFDGGTTSTHYFLGYESTTAPISVLINSSENVGSVTWQGFTDQFVNITSALSSDLESDSAGSFEIGGTDANDVFDISLQPNEAIIIFGRDGTDTYSIDAQDAGAWLVFSFGNTQNAPEGIQANLQTMEVQNDGFGNSERIQLTGDPYSFGLQGTDNRDTITTSSKNEFFYLLGDGDLIFANVGGDDTIFGGDGDDTVSVTDDLDSLTISFDRATSEMSNRDRPGVSSEMFDIENVETNGGIVFELDKHDGIGLISAENLTILTELYIAYFNRAADALGLSFWATAFQKNGFSFEEIADLFFTQPETVALYSGVSEADFVTAVYQNVFGRDPDQNGLAFWTDQLATGGTTESGFILDFLAGARAETGSPADVAYIEAKTDIGLYFAAIQGQSNLTAANDVMDAFNGSAQSIESARSLADASLAAAEAGTTELLLPVIGVVDNPFAEIV